MFILTTMDIDYSERLEDMDFWDEETEAIALTFQVPDRTASSWKRTFGDKESIEQNLGKNSPDGYLDLIRRREWIPLEQREIEADWVLSVKKWCVERSNGINLGHETKRGAAFEGAGPTWTRTMGLGDGWRAEERGDKTPRRVVPEDDIGINWSEDMLELQDEMERKEELVKYEMRKYDPEWIDRVSELWEVEKTLIGIYDDYVQNLAVELTQKKDKIITLKRAFPYLRDNNDLVARTIDCSRSYAAQFKEVPGAGIQNRKITGELRDQVFERDNDSCVSCGRSEDLVVHHIIPLDEGGVNELENLAVLCEDCHYFAHGGGHPTNRGHTTATFGSVEYEDKEEFWEDWIHQNFGNRIRYPS